MEMTPQRWTQFSTGALVVGILFLVSAFWTGVSVLYAVAAGWFALAAYFARKANQTATE